MLMKNEILMTNVEFYGNPWQSELIERRLACQSGGVDFDLISY